MTLHASTSDLSAAFPRPAPPVTVVVTGSDPALLERGLASLRGQTLRPARVVVLGRADDLPARILDGVVARLDASSIAPATWVENIADAFRDDPDLSALSGPVAGATGGVLSRASLRAALAHAPLLGSNWAVRASDWDEIEVLPTGDALPDGVALALLLGPERRIRFDRRMAVVGAAGRAVPVTDTRTAAALWLTREPWRRWRRRLTHSAHRRRQRAGRPRWRERSILVRWTRLFATRDPQTFTEKVRYKMLRDHRQVIATFADKAAVRAYVAERIGDRYLPEAYAIGDPAAIARAALPEEYVMKPTHGSGAAFVVSNRASAGTRLPTEDASWVYRHVLPEHADRGQLARLGGRWLEQLYGQGPNKEWAYGRIPRQIIVEELLVGDEGAIPDDYKFFVFHGRCEYIQVDEGRFDRRTQDFHLPDWTHLPLSGGPPWADPPHPRPGRLDEMVRLAETLGAETDFVRVDLYHLPDRVVFGELTSYPAGGYSPFEPADFDRRFGSHWTVPARYTG